MTTATQTTSTIGSEARNTMAVKGKGQFAPRTVFVNFKPYSYGSRLYSELGAAVLFDLIADAGWIRVTGVGNENLYFDFKTDSGEVLPGYCKCL